MPWGWDPGAKRYRDTETGRFMPRGTVLDYVQESINGTSVATDLLAQYVADGTTSPADFTDLFREEIKGEYIRQYLLGRGGREQMTQADWGSIGGMLKEQYSHLPDFQAALESGELSEAQIAARAQMYVRSSREAYERAHERNAEDLGLSEEKWVLGEAEHCEDCLEYAGMDWQPVGTFPTPGDGSTRCKTNCQCHKLWRNPETGQTL